MIRLRPWMTSRTSFGQPFEAQPKIMKIMARDYTPYQLDLNDDYDQKHLQFRERGAMAFEADPILREITLELE
jgi:hypothetical protein